MTALSNGHAEQREMLLRDRDVFAAHGDAMASALDDQIASMRKLLADELSGRRELERLLDESKERERRMARVIAILDGGAATPAQAKAQATGKQRGAKKGNGDWNVSDETVERVRMAFVRYAETTDEPVTRTKLAAWMSQHDDGIGGETIRRATEVLREREIVRKCGTTRGGGGLYTLMPGVADA